VVGGDPGTSTVVALPEEHPYAGGSMRDSCHRQSPAAGRAMARATSGFSGRVLCDCAESEPWSTARKFPSCTNIGRLGCAPRRQSHTRAAGDSGGLARHEELLIRATEQTFAHRVRVVQIGFRYVEVCSGRWSRHAPKSNASIDFCMLAKSSTKAFPRVQGQRAERADPSRRRGARKSLGGKHLSGSNGCLKT
jgi:hypothetical protein